MIRQGNGTAIRFRDLTKRLTLTAVCALVSACSGSSSSGGSDPTASPDGQDGGDVQPTLSLSVSPETIDAGESVTLTWDSRHASGCEASGGWGGARPGSGSEQAGPLSADTTFRLSCSGSGGGVSREVTVNVDAGDGPTVTLQAVPPQVAVDESTTLTWTSDDATRCSASGGWSGERDVSGSFDTGPLAQSATFSLSCSGASGNALASVTVEVLDKVLRWQAPTENVDGTPLTDLAGYVVHWGEQSRDYRSSHRIEDPAVTSWEVAAAPGSYFFALTAFDGDGSESGYSNEVRKTIP